MTTEDIFKISNYSVKLSDVISGIALIVAIFAATTTAIYTRRSDRRERERDRRDRERDQREREREDARTRLRVQVEDVSYDNDAPAAVRWFKLGIRCGEDNIPHILESCELVAPASSISVMLNGANLPARARKVNFPEDTIVGDEKIICVATEYSLPNVSNPAHLRLRSIRQDANHSPSVVDIKAPTGRPWSGRPGSAVS